MNAREKSMLIVTLLLLLALIGKSLFFDEVKSLNDQEQQFKAFADYSVAEKYNGKLQQYHIITYRVFDIFTADDKVNTMIRYKDETGKEIEKILDRRYTARVRAYLLGVFPYKQFSITAKPVNNKQ